MTEAEVFILVVMEPRRHGKAHSHREGVLSPLWLDVAGRVRQRLAPLKNAVWGMLVREDRTIWD